MWVYTCACVSVCTLLALCAGGLPERFINSLHLPIYLTVIVACAFICPVHTKADILIHSLSPSQYTLPSVFLFRHTHPAFPVFSILFLSLIPSSLYPSVSLPIIPLLSVSLLLCNKRYCRMDVPFIRTGIMF